MVGLRRPGGCLLRRRRPTPGARVPWKADFNRHESLRPAVGLRRPEKRSLRRRRPTPGARAPWKADFNRRESLRSGVGLCAEWIRPPGAFGRRSACADREGAFCVGEGRRPARSAQEGRFQSV